MIVPDSLRLPRGVTWHLLYLVVLLLYVMLLLLICRGIITIVIFDDHVPFCVLNLIFLLLLPNLHMLLKLLLVLTDGLIDKLTDTFKVCIVKLSSLFQLHFSYFCGYKVAVVELFDYLFGTFLEVVFMVAL